YIDLWHCVKKSTGPDDPPLGFSIEVESLVGIEYLENLWGLFCYDCNIKGSLNLSKNNRLEIVYCDGNEITELILGEQPELTDLYCGNNLIKEIDVSRVPRLSILHCPNNLLAALDLSCNFILEEIDCSNNRITYFDMAFCRNLVHLDATLCHPFYESKFLITKTIVRANT
ncbi:MAG: hypothetical protein LBH92_07595, partial [Bacteroidales bacterium]|nr:hypothetical protein [Bacteroidales bacterium]